jgi:hypothetical protein
MRAALLPLLLIAAPVAAPFAAQAQTPQQPPVPTPDAAPVPAGLSTTGQPTTFDVAGKPYIVDGYRSAKWGMSADAVRAAAARDFPGAAIQPAVANRADGTTIIVARLPSLAPGPGPAAVSYIFAAGSGRLIHVNIDWSFDRPTAANRQQITAAGAAVVGDFVSYYWKLMSVVRGVPVAADALLLFAGAGQAGGAVDVRLQGVGYRLRRPDGTFVDMPAPAADVPALLHISLAPSAAPLDLPTIKPGDF